MLKLVNEVTRVIKPVLLSAIFVMGGIATADTGTGTGQTLQLAQLTDGFDPEQKYMQGCFACHQSGAAGAPKLDDKADWDARMEKGMDAVMQNVLNGLNAMPARGLCFDCTDEDLRALVDWMYGKSQG